MENLMSLCTNKRTQITMDTTLTLMHTVYNLQCEQQVYKFKVKTSISMSTNETTQATIFLDWQQEPFGSECKGKSNQYKHFFMIASTDLYTFCNKDTCNGFCL